MLTEKQATKNIAKIASTASAHNWQQGKRWYREAHEFSKLLARHTGYPPKQIAGVIAALSPQCSWYENLRAARELCKTGAIQKTTCYPANIKKARAILAGAEPLDILGGNKVLAFYDNILSPETSQAATIDTHAARAAFDNLDLTAKHLSFVFRKSGNTIIQDAYRTVAQRYSVKPHVLQAVVWLCVKDTIKGLAPEKQGILYVK